MIISLLIDLIVGSSTFIKSKDLQSTDIDSDDTMLLYTITQDSPAGHLQYVKGGNSELISSKGPIRTFLQSDINSGYIQYIHQPGEMTGVVLFKFDVEDSDGNKLIDQDFFITIIGMSDLHFAVCFFLLVFFWTVKLCMYTHFLENPFQANIPVLAKYNSIIIILFFLFSEDRHPPQVVASRELVVREGSSARLTSEFLSYTDVDSEPASLQYFLVSAPRLGHLELTANPGIEIISVYNFFTMH